MKEDARLSGAGLHLLNRRHFLGQAASGLSSIALAHLFQSQGLLAAADTERLKKRPIRPLIDPNRLLAAREPQYPARARNVIVVFCVGGCSHIDTFDYKPELERFHGKPLPGRDKLVTFQGENGNLSRSLYPFRPRGESAKMTSDLLPRLGELADELCFIHSMTGKTNTHGQAETFMSTGFTTDGFPSMGAWVSYALGTESEDLPAFVAIPDARGIPQASFNNWGSGFLPAAFQGTAFNASKPVRNLRARSGIEGEGIGGQRDRAAREFLRLLNERHRRDYRGDNELAARIASYELAARMQLSIPRVTDLSREPASILKLYGADDAENKYKAAFARNCILARRLIEQGVRFVQLFNGAYPMGEGIGNWDGHRMLKLQYDVHGPILDQPVAALLSDLKQRGLLAETLVVWTTEFGRMPMFQKGVEGRDHNPRGFTCWLAGAGVKRAFSYGATDELGFKAVENVATVHDLHATILHLLGLDHERLSFYHNGTERRLTDVHGQVLQEILT
jgi:hypothetical protein